MNEETHGAAARGRPTPERGERGPGFEPYEEWEKREPIFPEAYGTQAEYEKRHGLDVTVDDLRRSGYVSPDELPDVIIGRVKHTEKTLNRWGNDVILFRLDLEDGRYTTISYPRTTWPALADFMEKHKLVRLRDFEGLIVKFRREKVGRVIKPRHMPVAILGEGV